MEVVIAALIGGVFSLLGIWLKYHLERRAERQKETSPKQSPLHAEVPQTREASPQSLLSNEWLLQSSSPKPARSNANKWFSAVLIVAWLIYGLILLYHLANGMSTINIEVAITGAFIGGILITTTAVSYVMGIFTE